MILILKYWRYLALLSVLGAVFYAGAHWQSGRDARKAADIAAKQAILDSVAAENYSKAMQHIIAVEHTAQDLNRRVYADLEPKLALATADGRRLASLLHASAARASCDAPVAPADQPAVAGASAVTGGEIEAAEATYYAACDSDALRFGALQEQVRGQM